MRLGLVGRNWGAVYARTLDKLGIDYWHAGRDWKDIQDATDGVIIASSSESHYPIAKALLILGVPVLIEKPACMKSSQVRELIGLGGIAFVAHTRLFSPAWRAFRQPAKRVEAFAGGVTKTNPDAVLNWGVHLAAMCWDVGISPRDAQIRISETRQPLRFIADGREFRDVDDNPIEVLVHEFVEAIEHGKPNTQGLHMALKTLEYVESVRS